ncbi:hypothetical protein MGG_08671 [Pyricularia oryzae 70-15]|uniref:PaxB protein n=3 Tax=Pyricularia oryzae TaxID=318829 RepID=G4NFX9_PYRO7|nr:uncharacterized protein MGG_08671 [Pyricularia oryzae 70-15]EHA46936.1 hypothetical protein MGG_08671 [Pyricularia oryzae 70-15]ELQ41054.1 hypothetical protein OOU_Y34scaffold00306g8 [Pyricularia oryzae Y34]KAI7910823.1 hypothetical protein M9X92_010873 [Pyricularia oryzae]KAI7911156.1 hypothetical protein M0657_011078 [Pyricularia oryzae]
MGLKDTPPPHVPEWLPIASTCVLGVGAVCWYLTYILITIRATQTKSYGMPLMATVLNWSWEVIYAFYAAEHPIEFLGLAAWFTLDIGMVYTTVVYAPHDWKYSSRRVGRHMFAILLGLTAVGVWGNYAFAEWFLAEEGRGFGDKTGKWFRGREGFDTMEMAFWSALVPQAYISGASLAMLISRGHSGGVSYAIWFVRSLGSFVGLVALPGMMWWYWPEAHGYFLNPLATFMQALFLLPDIVYPFVLYQIRKTEVVLPDGRLVSAEHAVIEKRLEGYGLVKAEKGMAQDSE